MPVLRARPALACAVLALAVAPAAAHAASSDSLAPPDAPAHWLPPEPWVYNHWLPFDEGRLHALLRTTRQGIWHHLRDDRNTLAQLARTKGLPDPRALAERLMAPRAGRLTARQLAVLTDRAERVLTQGHLAQHVLFHSLHQFAIPSMAPEIFGVSDAEFRALRRRELSPLEIGRLHGRSAGRIQSQSLAVLEERVVTGVRGKAMTARQGELLLARQRSQLPRWLGQARYNGPPQTHEGELVARPQDYASNPAVSADGLHVAYEAYRQKLPVALTRGEIAVEVHDVASGAAALASFPLTPAAEGRPASAYNPTISADGRLVVYETADGNLNFAKRYGQIDLVVRDRAAGTTTRVARPLPEDRGISRSAWSPALSADGRRLAYVASRASGRSGVWVQDLASGSRRLVSGKAAGEVFEPSLSADGAVVAFTAVGADGDTELWAASTATGAGEVVAGGSAANPSLSADGRRLAYVAPSGGVTRIHVRDLLTDRTIAVPQGPGGHALDPSLSGDGTTVAWTAVEDGRPRVLLCRLGEGTVRTIAEGGDAGDPSLSADGRTVAFASSAAGLDPAKPAGARGVFAFDATSGAVRLLAAGPRA